MVSLQDIKSSDNIGMRQGIIALAIQRIAESPETPFVVMAPGMTYTT